MKLFLSRKNNLLKKHILSGSYGYNLCYILNYDLLLKTEKIWKIILKHRKK